MILREYQKNAITKVLYSLPKNPILVSPTGSGKTVMASALVQEANCYTLWLAHRKELIDQGAASLRDHGLSVGIIKSGYSTNNNPVQVASVQTLVRRHMPNAELIVIDECHHAVGNSYQTILDQYPNVPRVGLTATPFRLDGKGLKDVFGEIVVSATAEELIEQGYLHKPKVWTCSQPDLAAIKKTAGDYNLKQLDEAVNQTTLIGDIVDTWIKRANAYKTVVFAVSIEHSKNIVRAFREAGVAAEHLDGNTPKEDRAAILCRLRTGETTVISNCMVLTEGWDLPALECAIIARPTASLCLHLQMIGRVMRATEGKDGAVILDHAGNHHQHGSVTRKLTYSLESAPKTTKGEPLGLKTCPECFLLVEPQEKVCPDCDYEFINEREIKAEGGELTEFNEDSWEYHNNFWISTENERFYCGYKSGWSLYRYKDRFGNWPPVCYPHGRDNEGIFINPEGDMDHKRLVWKGLDAVRKSKGYKRGWTAYQYRKHFGVWPRNVEDVASKLEKKREQWQLNHT